MKLFGELIQADAVENGTMIEVCFDSQYTNETRFVWGTRSTPYHHRFTVMSVGGVIHILPHLVRFVRPINIDFNQTYIFIINEYLDVTGKLVQPETLDGFTQIISQDGHPVNIHISQITGVFPVNEYSNIMYPLAAAAAGDNTTVYNAFASITDPEHKDFFKGGKKAKSVKKQRRRKN